MIRLFTVTRTLSEQLLVEATSEEEAIALAQQLETPDFDKAAEIVDCGWHALPTEEG